MGLVLLSDTMRIKRIALLALKRWEDSEVSWATEYATSKQEQDKKIAAIQRKINKYRKEIEDIFLKDIITQEGGSDGETSKRRRKD
jgi:hypothetical protein